MPIRIEKDPDQGGGKRDNFPENNNNPGRRGGGGGGLSSLLPMILMFVGKNPKLLLPILLIGGGLYFFGGGLFSNNGGGGGGGLDALFSTGMQHSIEKYDKAEVFEPLADNRKNPLPERVSLEEFAPKRLNQGRQGSCVGWASAYAARTILHSKATNANPSQNAFSPSYLYNQIALTNCQGAYIGEAMKAMKQVGSLPLSQFPYDERSCNDNPSQRQKQAGARNAIRGFNRLTQGHDKYKVDMLAMKQNLSQGAPVVIGMMVGGSFMRSMQGQQVWMPTRSDYNLAGFSGHAMCVIGYDDYLEGGSFQIMNSWGEGWGEDGIGWVRYKDFEHFTREAYGLYPMGDANASNSNRLQIRFGLLKNNADRNIPLKLRAGNTFYNTQPIRKGDKFKIEVTNSVECYTYLFGEETDGSSYVLFPYTKKHSPFCGITGTRLFPKDHSLVADDIGNKDQMAIVVTKEPIDYVKLNELINQSNGRSYGDKIFQVLGDIFIDQPDFKAGSDFIQLSGTTAGNKMASFAIIEIAKQ